MKPRFHIVFAIALGWAALLGAAEIEGRYRNPEYGYSIAIPPGLKGSTAPAPAPQHGFRLRLPEPGNSFLWVDGSYNSGEQHSAREILEDDLKDLRSQAKIESVARSKTHLGRLPADSISIRYRLLDSQETMVREEIAALRLGAPPGIVYTIGMIVPAGRRPSRQAIFKSLADSFHMEKLPR